MLKTLWGLGKPLLAFLTLIAMQNALAQTDLLNLGAYQEGDVPTYGENIVVGQDEQTGAKWITRGELDKTQLGSMSFPVNVSGDFELFIKADFDYSSGINLFLTSDEYQLKFYLYDGGIGFYAGGDNVGNDESSAWKIAQTNEIRLSVVNNVAKLYINDVFSRKATLGPDLTYTLLKMDGINAGAFFYALTLNGPSATTSASSANTASNTNVGDLLNFEVYQEGDIPTYGENIVVGQDEQTGAKWVTQGEIDKTQLGSMTFPVNITGDFELFIKADFDYSSAVNLFLTSDEYQLKFSLDRVGVSFYAGGDYAGNDESSAWKREQTNEIRLSVVNNVAKLYINDIFSRKATLRPDLTYTLLKMDGINAGAFFYALTLGGASATTTTTPTTPEQPTTTTTTPTVESGCMATYAPDTGRVLIPYIVVPDALGGTTVYSVEMQQQPATFTFDLDLNTVQPR